MEAWSEEWNEFGPEEFCSVDVQQSVSLPSTNRFRLCSFPQFSFVLENSGECSFRTEISRRSPIDCRASPFVSEVDIGDRILELLMCFTLGIWIMQMPVVRLMHNRPISAHIVHDALIVHVFPRPR